MKTSITTSISFGAALQLVIGFIAGLLAVYGMATSRGPWFCIFATLAGMNAKWIVDGLQDVRFDVVREPEDD